MGKKLKTKSKILRKWAKKHGIKQVNLKLSDYPDTDVRGLPQFAGFAIKRDDPQEMREMVEREVKDINEALEREKSQAKREARDRYNRMVDDEVEALIAEQKRTAAKLNALGDDFSYWPPLAHGIPKTETTSPKFSVHKMKPGKKGKAIPAKETFMKTKVEVGPEVRASDFEQEITSKVFLPKDRDGALMLIKHELYHRLMRRDNARPDELDKHDECDWLRNLLDLIERS
jgi:hypothetical protein